MPAIVFAVLPVGSTATTMSFGKQFTATCEMLNAVAHDQSAELKEPDVVARIDQFRYIKIQLQTIDIRTRLWGINPTNSVFIPQSLVLRSIV